MKSDEKQKKDRIHKNKYIIKNQIPYALGIFVLALMFGIFLHTKSFDLSFYWMIGLCFGFVLQRSRFCFTASFRDPYLTGSTALTRALLLAFALTSVGFTIIKYLNYINGNTIPGMNFVVPTSVATVIGAFIFGIGMVISGGCASGTFMRIGEGFQL
ncbi:MAG: YeeE/YedE thiosulfate transporter family protein, partial [bacterium]